MHWHDTWAAFTDLSCRRSSLFHAPSRRARPLTCSSRASTSSSKAPWKWMDLTRDTPRWHARSPSGKQVHPLSHWNYPAEWLSSPCPRLLRTRPVWSRDKSKASHSRLWQLSWACNLLLIIRRSESWKKYKCCEAFWRLCQTYRNTSRPRTSLVHWMRNERTEHKLKFP